jgi:long-chain acyl-CoA synthetase
MNLTDLMDKAADSWPQKAAMIEGQTVVTYKELAARIEVFSRQLTLLRLDSCVRVGLQLPNGIDYVALTFALWRIQAVVVPIPMECTDEEVTEIVTTMALAAIIGQVPGPASLPLGANCFFTKLDLIEAPDNHGLNIAFIRFTSGTTTARKGVVLCHETIRDRVLAANKGLRIGPADTVAWCLPMSHHFLVTIVLYLSQGATIVLARHVVARPFLEAINQWQCTVLYAAPFHYSLLARDNSGLDIPSVRLAVSTTCPLPENVGSDFARRFGVHLIQGLGVIELGLVTLNTEDPQGRPRSVGRPLEDFQVRIIAPDESGTGELAVSGPGMFDGYAAPWMPRERVLRDGWFHTGDIGRMDEAGFLVLSGRKTSVINLAGRKVFPEEIEAVLNRHPSVKESRAYGLPHPHLGEVVEADLVLEGSENDLESVRRFCRAHLAQFKIPTRLNVVSALPRTAAGGKIQRTACAP